MTVPFGVRSMVSQLESALVHAPDDAFARAHQDPAHGYLRPVNLQRARHEHDGFVQKLLELGVTVHHLDGDPAGPDLIYPYDPALVTTSGAILLRPGKPARRGEVPVMEAWFDQAGIPICGRIEPPGTADGGDVFWLRPDLICVGRSLRTNEAGIEQLRGVLPGRVEVFDVPVAGGPAQCVHLMSAISMISDALAVVDPPLLPAGLYALLRELDVDLVEIPPHESASLAANALAVRPGVVVTVAGNPETHHKLEQMDVEVHPVPGSEICINGTGGPTCLTRPIRRR